MDYNFLTEQYKTLVTTWTNFQKESMSYLQHLPQQWKFDSQPQGKEFLKKAIQAQIDFLKNSTEKQQELQSNYIDLLAKVSAIDFDAKTFNYAELAKIFADYNQKSQEFIQQQLIDNFNLIKKSFEQSTKHDK